MNDRETARDLSKRLEKANEEIDRLKADIVSGLLRNHDSCLIQKDEEYTKLECKYNNLKDELQKGGAND